MSKYMKVTESAGNQYFLCDRNKNHECSRVKLNIPCGDCIGTKDRTMAKIFNDNYGEGDYIKW